MTAAFLSDNTLDASLNYVKNNTTTLYIDNAQPTSYAQASSTYALGSKATPSFTGPADGDASGRKLTVSAVTDGSVATGGTASWVALTSGSELIACQALNATQVVAAGNTFTLTAFTITIPDPTA